MKEIQAWVWIFRNFKGIWLKEDLERNLELERQKFQDYCERNT